MGTDKHNAQEWQLPFMDLTTQHGICTFVVMRKFYLQHKLENNYQVFSVPMGAVAVLTAISLTVLVIAVIALTPDYIRKGDMGAIVAFNYLWIVAAVVLCGMSMTLLGSAAAIYLEQAKHKDLLKACIRDLHCVCEE